MMSMVLKKTELGQAEIRTKAQALGMSERRALILMDGSRDLAQVEAIIGASLQGIAKRLLHLGLVSAAQENKGRSRAPSAMEFKDSLVGKTPATNFESFDHYLPTHSTVWQKGSYEKAADSGRSSSFSASTQSALHSAFVPVTPAPAAQPAALSMRGVLLGKMYLADLVERMLGKDDVYLRTKIQQVGSEAQLLNTCEEVMELIKSLTTPDMLGSIERRFMECIHKK
jgi:hypothetical protein